MPPQVAHGYRGVPTGPCRRPGSGDNRGNLLRSRQDVRGRSGPVKRRIADFNPGGHRRVHERSGVCQPHRLHRAFHQSPDNDLPLWAAVWVLRAADTPVTWKTDSRVRGLVVVLNTWTTNCRARPTSLSTGPMSVRTVPLDGACGPRPGTPMTFHWQKASGLASPGGQHRSALQSHRCLADVR